MNAPTTTLGFSQATVQYVCGDKDGREIGVAIYLRPVTKFSLNVIASFCLLPHLTTVTFNSEVKCQVCNIPEVTPVRISHKRNKPRLLPSPSSAIALHSRSLCCDIIRAI